MADVICEWMMCVYNASNVPQKAGACLCTNVVKLTSVDITTLLDSIGAEEADKLGEKGMALVCNNFTWSRRKEEASVGWLEEQDG